MAKLKAWGAGLAAGAGGAPPPLFSEAVVAKLDDDVAVELAKLCGNLLMWHGSRMEE